jgi:Asp-tRNA(Asn)/Glu-tRNA(Gln) amidotransferase A subunit family amidase
MKGTAPMSALAIASAVRAGLEPDAPVSAALARVERYNPALNALCHVLTDIDAQAARLRARLDAGEDLPLAGVPVAIKDNIWVKGAPITQGSRLFRDFQAPQDARAVARLRAAGAMILGIGTCSEFACKGVTTTPLHGVTRHPADPALTPGGSSGGGDHVLPRLESDNTDMRRRAATGAACIGTQRQRHHARGHSHRRPALQSRFMESRFWHRYPWT